MHCSKGGGGGGGLASHPIQPLRIRPLVVHTRPEYFSGRQDKLFDTVQTYMVLVQNMRPSVGVPNLLETLFTAYSFGNAVF